MIFVDFGNKKVLVGFLILICLSCFSHSFHVSPFPCNVSFTESCAASLYYVPKANKSLGATASLFNVNTNVVKRTIDGFLIAINCSCPADHTDFTWHMDYTVQPGDMWESVSSKFGTFVVEKPDKVLIASQIVTLDLYCGCSKSIEIMTYRVKSGDTLFTICSHFNTSVEETAKLNMLENPGPIYEGDVIFIPEPNVKNLVAPDDNDMKKPQKLSKSHSPIVLRFIIAAAAVVLISVMLILWEFHKRNGTQESKACSWGNNCLPCYYTIRPSRTSKGSEESAVSSFNSDKATVFPYYEICDATSNFSASLKIGQGSYGSVYLGKLRGTDVAIKRMKNTKSKEFLSELNILCKVHHANLIELIGYAAGGDSLFLVYEFAQNGALSDHLHRPITRDYKPLPWTTRVKIALDAAKGLEHIHVHTIPYYVHRDVKTSNILLDSNFCAKIADFGLVKLLEHSPEIGTAASRIVGTFGYLAPEYVRDGHVTTKSDVYSFGVVLMELLTSQPALSRDANPGNDQYAEHRSLVEYMLSALNDGQDPWTQLTKCIDPNLTLYHKDSLLQMARLAKDCVDDDWNRRPNMFKVVLRLSHIFLMSGEWEKQECTENPDELSLFSASD